MCTVNKNLKLSEKFLKTFYKNVFHITFFSEPLDLNYTQVSRKHFFSLEFPFKFSFLTSTKSVGVVNSHWSFPLLLCKFSSTNVVHRDYVEKQLTVSQEH